MTWSVWAGDGPAERVELVTLEATGLGALWLGLALVLDPLVAGVWLVGALLVDPVFGPIPQRDGRVGLLGSHA
jgi:hypothetical protein